MGKTKTIIEINGKQYNADTGELLSPAADVVSHKAEHSVPAPKVHTVRQPAPHVAAHQPGHTQTLMRHSVKRPAEAKHLKATSPVDAVAKSQLAAISKAQSAKLVDQHRMSRAQNVTQSTAIKRFSSAKLLPGATTTPFSHHVQHEPRPHAVTTPSHKRPTTTADLLERAIQTATSHEQPAYEPAAHHRRSRRTVALATGATLSVLAIAIVANLQVPTMRLHTASAAAGFTATLPAKQPAGYRLGQLHYSAGQVASEFQSNSDDRSYTITQKPSQWTDDNLVHNYLQSTDPSYRTVTSGSRTVYLYGKHNATWLTGGIWYQLQSDGSLSDHQLVDLASQQ